ncbi:uncharacterized protein LOC135493155 isoform X2 [Lineus longissimus]|uniref:uncharacterized protein LOC135493155 isoform X2 n=1 Tax=Lineus longissimus TaxID=88925 RepID=UPI00315DDCA5
MDDNAKNHPQRKHGAAKSSRSSRSSISTIKLPPITTPPRRQTSPTVNPWFFNDPAALRLGRGKRSRPRCGIGILVQSSYSQRRMLAPLPAVIKRNKQAPPPKQKTELSGQIDALLLNESRPMTELSESMKNGAEGMKELECDSNLEPENLKPSDTNSQAFKDFVAAFDAIPVDTKNVSLSDISGISDISSLWDDDGEDDEDLDSDDMDDDEDDDLDDDLDDDEDDDDDDFDMDIDIEDMSKNVLPSVLPSVEDRLAPMPAQLTLAAKVKRLFQGDVELDYPASAKIVRIFTSSTFTDTHHERNYLMKKTYPELKKFCHGLGYEFQVVDMRWGIREYSNDEHTATELCLQELKLCKDLSTGPFFVTFLSHKYGYCPLPRVIDGEEFELLLIAVVEDSDHDLISKWYQKDYNVVPAAYILQPISTYYPDVLDKRSIDVQKAAKRRWWADEERISEILARAAAQKLPDTKDIQKYLISVTENEIRDGILEAADIGDHCLWFYRDIEDIYNQPKNYAFGRYTDVKTNEAQTAKVIYSLENLKSKLCFIMPKNNIKEYILKWDEAEGINPTSVPEHAKYLEELAQDFENQMKSLIERGIEKKQKIAIHDSLYEEVLQHTAFCQEKISKFHGREDTIQEILNYFETSGKSKPFVVHGKSGCGKTSIMAAAAQKIKLKPRTLVLLRFIGTTQESSGIRQLLVSVMNQMFKVQSKQPPDFPADMKGLITKFTVAIHSMAIWLKIWNCQAVILLDSLDQLNPDDGALQLAWLPVKLPERVKIVVSTLPDKEYECLPRLQALIPSTNFLEVPTLSDTDVNGILQLWFNKTHRTLTSEQQDILANAFHKCPLPLFLKLSFDESCRWSSYYTPDRTVLEHTIREAIISLFNQLEKKYGTLLVSKALRYMTLAGRNNGLTETELEDLLSCDDDILNDVYQYWTPPIRRLPPLLLVRLLNDIRQYLVTRGADGFRVVYWYHRQFIEAAQEQYCTVSEEDTKAAHFAIAEYFLGTWSGVPKPYIDKKGIPHEDDRILPEQPIKFTEDLYNYRKLMLLPTHLAYSGNLNLLKTEVLCNYTWLYAKLKAKSLRHVLDDYQLAAGLYSSDTDIPTIMSMLQLSQVVIQIDVTTLAGQAVGRIKEADSPHMKEFLSQCCQPSDPGFIPEEPFLFSVGGELAHTIRLHKEDIYSLAITKDGKYAISTGDEAIKVTAISDGTVKKSYTAMVKPTNRSFYDQVRICGKDGELFSVLLSLGYNSRCQLFILKVETGEVVHQLSVFTASVTTHVFDDGCKLAALIGNSLFIFDVYTGEKVKITDTLLEKGQKYGNEDLIGGNKKYLVFSCLGTRYVRIFDIEKNEIIKNVEIYARDMKIPEDDEEEDKGKADVSNESDVNDEADVNDEVGINNEAGVSDEEGVNNVAGVNDEADDKKKVKNHDTDEDDDENEDDDDDYDNVTIDGLAVTPDEEYVVLANCSLNDLEYFSLPEMEKVKTYQGHRKDYSEKFQILPDGKHLVLPGMEHSNVIAWDLVAGTRHTILAHEHAVQFIAAVDMKTFVTTSTDNLLRIWHREDTALPVAGGKDGPDKETVAWRFLTLNPKNPRYLLGSYTIKDAEGKTKDIQLFVLDLMSREIVRSAAIPSNKYSRFYINEDKISQSQFINDHQFIMCIARKLVIVNLDTLEVVRILDGSIPKINHCVGIINDATECICLSRGSKNLKISNLATGKTVAILRNELDNKKEPGDAQKEIKLTKSGKVKKKKIVRYDSVLTNPNGTYAVAATDGMKTQLHVFDVVNRKFLHRIDLNPYAKDVDIYLEGSRIWSQDGNLMVVQGSGVIRKKHQQIKPRLESSVMVFYVWDIAKGDMSSILYDWEHGLLHEQKKRENSPEANSLYVAANDVAYVSCDDFIVRAHDIHSGDLLYRLEGHGSHGAEVISLSLDHRRLVTYNSSSEELACFVWDLVTHKRLTMFRFDAEISSVAAVGQCSSLIIAGKSKLDMKYINLHGEGCHSYEEDLKDLPEMFSGKVLNVTLDPLTEAEILQAHEVHEGDLDSDVDSVSGDESEEGTDIEDSDEEEEVDEYGDDDEDDDANDKGEEKALPPGPKIPANLTKEEVSGYQNQLMEMEKQIEETMKLLEEAVQKKEKEEREKRLKAVGEAGVLPKDGAVGMLTDGSVKDEASGSSDNYELPNDEIVKETVDAESNGLAKGETVDNEADQVAEGKIVNIEMNGLAKGETVADEADQVQVVRDKTVDNETTQLAES